MAAKYWTCGQHDGILYATDRFRIIVAKAIWKMAWKGVEMQQYGIINNTYSAAIYCRFSKDDGRVEDSSSIHTQKMMLEKYCIEQGYSGLQHS